MCSSLPTFLERVRKFGRVELLSILAIVWLTISVPVQVRAQTPDQDLSQAPTSALENEANKLVNAKNFAAALPYLKELAQRYKGAGNSELKDKLASVLFYLGVSYMQIEKLTEAIDTFGQYIEQYPSGSRAREALQLQGDCFRRTEDYEQAAARYERLKNDYPMEQEAMMDLMTKLAGCYISQLQWDKAVPLLETIWKASYNPEIRGKAATALTRAYVELDRIDDIFALLPELQARGSASRYEVEFNLAMIQAGDKMFLAKRYPIALLLYQLALSKEDLMRWLDEQDKKITEQRNAPKGLNVDLRQIAELNERAAKIKDERKALQESDSYTEELRLRLARTYYELGRKWEALWSFSSIWKDFPKSPLAEQGLFGAFELAAEMGFDERAVELGLAYLKDYEKGERYDDVSLQLGQIYLRRHEYDKTIELYKKVLEAKPDHTFSDQMVFTIGYTYFQLEQFDHALETFSDFRKKYPNSPSREACDYWMGLTFIFQKDYKSAKDEFSEFVAKYQSGDYYEDANFRVGVCHYGLLEFVEARKSFEDFVRHFPSSNLRGEAHVMLGDIAGADGRLDDAIKEYKLVESYTSGMTHINYAAFQIGKIQEMQKDFKGMAELFQNYLRKYDLKGNYTEAIWRIGFAKKQMGDTQGMLDEYFSAIKRYGDDPSAIGIDLILDEWPSYYKSFHSKDPREPLKEELVHAQFKKQRAMALRLQMALFKLGEKAPALSEEDLSFASPAVLIWMGQESASKPDLARKAFQRVLDLYSQTEWSEPALIELAEVEAKAGQYPKAVALFRQVQERFPTSPRAGTSMKREADLLREQKKYKEAISIYEKILQVKDWRGPLWAESLYQIGLCNLDQKNFKEAFAYFQRVYVLYQNYVDWVARSYLQSGICLEKLNHREEAIKTYQEMLGLPKLKGTPEYQEATQRLAKLQ